MVPGLSQYSFASGAWSQIVNRGIGPVWVLVELDLILYSPLTLLDRRMLSIGVCTQHYLVKQNIVNCHPCRVKCVLCIEHLCLFIMVHIRVTCLLWANMSNMCAMPMPCHDMWMDMRTTCEVWGPECILRFDYICLQIPFHCQLSTNKWLQCL